MKQIKFLCASLGILSFMLLVNCGEAGVQIKVGGDYDTEFNANNPALVFAQTFNQSGQSTINSEFREYGDFIEEVEVKSLVVRMDNFDNSINGEIIVLINGNEFRTNPTTPDYVPISDGSVLELEAVQTNGIINLGEDLRRGDVGISLTLNSDRAFDDDAFDAILSILAFATVQVD